MITLTNEAKKKRTNENMTMINEEMRKKVEGSTLGEKIYKQLDKVKAKKVARHIDAAFFEEEVENQSKFYVRRLDFF